VGKFYQGLDLLLLFEELVKEYVDIVQNIKVHLESLLPFHRFCNVLVLLDPLKMEVSNFFVQLFLLSSHSYKKAL
jgi:hypothetical protein